MKLAILFDWFGPYHAARLRAAAARGPVLALEGAPQRAVYDWAPVELPREVIRAAVTRAPGEERDEMAIERGLAAALDGWRPDALAIPGWSSRLALVALRWARRRGVQAICMSDSNGWDYPRQWWRERVKRGIVAHFAAGMTTSASQRGYLAALGIDPGCVFGAYNCVDNEAFARSARVWREAAGLPRPICEFLPPSAKDRYLLACSRFIEVKNLRRLIEAYARFRAERSGDLGDWPLVLLGDGELRTELGRLAVSLGVARHLHMPGFAAADQLPKYYGTAGGFILASTKDTWGLVVNEAMASGLPCAVSRRCGAAEFLIVDGVTGFDFDPYSVDEIARAMSKLSARPPSLARAAAARIGELSPERFGESVFAAASAALRRPAQPGLFDRRLLDLAIRRHPEARPSRSGA